MTNFSGMTKLACNYQFAIFLLFLITWQLVFKVSIVALWKINQDYVVANFCGNRNKPASTCKLR
jgi:hypothetical protein